MRYSRRRLNHLFFRLPRVLLLAIAGYLNGSELVILFGNRLSKRWSQLTLTRQVTLSHKPAWPNFDHLTYRYYLDKRPLPAALRCLFKNILRTTSRTKYRMVQHALRKKLVGDGLYHGEIETELRESSIRLKWDGADLSIIVTKHDTTKLTRREQENVDRVDFPELWEPWYMFKYDDIETYPSRRLIRQLLPKWTLTVFNRLITNGANARAKTVTPVPIFQYLEVDHIDTVYTVPNLNEEEVISFFACLNASSLGRDFRDLTVLFCPDAVVDWFGNVEERFKAVLESARPVSQIESYC